MIMNHNPWLWIIIHKMQEFWRELWWPLTQKAPSGPPLPCGCKLVAVDFFSLHKTAPFTCKFCEIMIFRIFFKTRWSFGGCNFFQTQPILKFSKVSWRSCSNSFISGVLTARHIFEHTYHHHHSGNFCENRVPGPNDTCMIFIVTWDSLIPKTSSINLAQGTALNQRLSISAFQRYQIFEKQPRMSKVTTKNISCQD